MEVLNGPDLIQTVISLTELPEAMVHREVNEILENSGHASETLTLEQLRAAMITYLESMAPNLEEASNYQDSVNDALDTTLDPKASVFFE